MERKKKARVGEERESSKGIMILLRKMLTRKKYKRERRIICLKKLDEG